MSRPVAGGPDNYRAADTFLEHAEAAHAGGASAEATALGVIGLGRAVQALVAACVFAADPDETGLREWQQALGREER